MGYESILARRYAFSRRKDMAIMVLVGLLKFGIGLAIIALGFTLYHHLVLDDFNREFPFVTAPIALVYTVLAVAIVLFGLTHYAIVKRRKQKENFVTVISVISMLGIMVGTAALITVLAVFNGFSTVVTNVLVSFDPHLRITALSADSTLESPATLSNTSALEAKLLAMPEVLHAAPVVSNKTVLVHFTLPRVAILTGIDQKKAEQVSGLKSSIQTGKLQLDSNSIVVGQLLADQLALIVGDTIDAYSPVGLAKVLTEPVAPRVRPLIVRGIFAANNREYDAMNCYTSLDVARDLFDVPQGNATSMDIKLHSIEDANSVKEKLLGSLSAKTFKVQTWYDLHTDLYSVMEIERWIAYTILFLIVGVASFNIFSSLTMTVFQKQRDIGLLRALGASAKGIRNIFILQGSFVGLIGTIVGCLLGLTIVVLQQQFGFFKLDVSVYIIPALPVELRWSDFVVVGIGSLALATFGAYIPARKASSVRPSEALRWE
ncbi:MAG: FtsX-like permease family protein [Candidatus Kapaibacterium sp.]|jgi:lipoprotein-releasing system permease protein